MTKEEFLLKEFKEVVLKEYPSARIKFSIVLAGARTPIAIGDSESEAWMLAAEDILNDKPF